MLRPRDKVVFCVSNISVKPLAEVIDIVYIAKMKKFQSPIFFDIESLTLTSSWKNPLLNHAGIVLYPWLL
jgi:hypothetical protein